MNHGSFIANSRRRWPFGSFRSTAWLIVGAFTGIASADDWSQFRGPGGNAVAPSSVPTEWSKDKNIAWTIEVPGVAWSSPIVVGDKVIVTTAVTENQAKPKPFSFGGGGGFGRGLGGAGKGARKDGEQDYKKAAKDAGDGEGKGAEKKRFGGGAGFGKGQRKGGGGFGGLAAEPPNKLYKWSVMAYDLKTGKQLWAKQVEEKKPTIPTHDTNTYASETPVSDGKHVYAYFGMTGLYCLDLNGNVVWNKDVGTFPMQFGWGTGSSPTLDDARIFVQCDNEKESFLVALDKKNGKEIWRKKRDGKSGWSTPYLWKNDSRTELVCIGSTKAESYDPATGEVIWVINELDAGPISSPVSTSKMLYFGSSNPFRGKSPLIAIKAGAKGDITLKTSETKNSGIAWMKTGAAPGYASPILVDDKLYVIAQRGGVFSCYDGATGDRLFQERLPGAGGFTSSPWSAGGRIYCTDENGKTFVLQAGSTFKLIGTNSVEDMFWSSPAIGDRTIVLRGRDKIYAIR